MISGIWRITRNYSLVLILGFCFLSCSKRFQEDSHVESSLESKETVSGEWIFPEDWLGYWEGSLAIYNENGLSQTIPMALDNRKTDTVGIYHWAIIYGEDTIAGRRDYYLEEVDKAKGHYITDERNSILLDSYLRGNALCSAFEVQGNYLSSTYTRTGNGLTFEIIMMKDKEGKETGGISKDTSAVKQIPIVNVYPVVVRQVAHLKRR